MQFKQHQSSLLIHRPRKRRNLVPENNKTESKNQNLKSLHQTLLCDNSYRKKPAIVERSSISKLMPQNNRSLSRKQGSEASRDNERPVNFYINIEKLKNLRISHGKEEDPRRIRNNHQASNPYLTRGGPVERRSQLLKRYNLGKKQHQSQEQIIYESTNRLSKEREVRSKGRNRYRSEASQDTSQVTHNPSKHNKTPIYKKTQNELVLKDKTFIEGYLKGKQLGRGGFSKVWEGFHFKSKVFYAVKEIDTTNKYQTHLTEIWFGKFFFEGGKAKEEFAGCEGIKSLLTMYCYSIMDPRAFIVYENCHGSLGNMLYDIYEEDREEDINEDDKLYMIKYKGLYSELRRDSSFLKTMLLQIAQALQLLAEHKIVHSDLKTENILMNIRETHPRFQFKLIDYGSSFVFENLKQYKLATPEYMCPELLNYILYENKKPHKEEMLAYIRKYENISGIDVWGLGCILIELVHGLPLWLNNRTKLLVNGKYETKRGLFAVSDRSFAKILERQLQVVNNFETFINKQNNAGIYLDDTLKTIIKGMLIADPSKRMRPHEIVAILKGEGEGGRGEGQPRGQGGQRQGEGQPRGRGQGEGQPRGREQVGTL